MTDQSGRRQRERNRLLSVRIRVHPRLLSVRIRVHPRLLSVRSRVHPRLISVRIRVHPRLLSVPVRARLSPPLTVSVPFHPPPKPSSSPTLGSTTSAALAAT